MELSRRDELLARIKVRKPDDQPIAEPEPAAQPAQPEPHEEPEIMTTQTTQAAQPAQPTADEIAAADRREMRSMVRSLTKQEFNATQALIARGHLPTLQDIKDIKARGAAGQL
ncbi:MAG: hypothetical protein WCC64_09920 [Aliidongia sp.]